MGYPITTSTAFTILFGATAPLLNPKWYAPWKLNLDYIARTLHIDASSTQIYTKPDGVLNATRMDSMFQESDLDKDGFLSYSEAQAMIERNAKSLIGKIRSQGEFLGLLFPLNGVSRELPDGSTELVIPKEIWDSMYEGTLFFNMAGETPPWCMATPQRPARCGSTTRSASTPGACLGGS